MNVFETVKYGVNCREAAERYGMEVNRYGMAICPFHNDQHPSLYLADDHYHCFACGARGDVIDFAANLFGLPLYEAAQRLADTLASMRTDRQHKPFLKNADRNQKHSSSWKTSGCPLRVYPAAAGLEGMLCARIAGGRTGRAVRGSLS